MRSTPAIPRPPSPGSHPRSGARYGAILLTLILCQLAGCSETPAPEPPLDPPRENRINLSKPSVMVEPNDVYAELNVTLEPSKARTSSDRTDPHSLKVISADNVPVNDVTQDHPRSSRAPEAAVDAVAPTAMARPRLNEFAVGALTLGGAMAPSASGVTEPIPLPPLTAEDRERYAKLTENGVLLTREQPVSTFSIDVDTGSYANVRRFLNQGQLPPKDAVRTEELINYFDYAYPRPHDRGQPLALTTELAPTPWNPNTHLLLIGLQGYVPEQRPAANLVFLIDVSGSMDQPNKLPLLINAFKLLAGQLEARDRVSLVTYAGNAGVVLEPTPGDQGAKILGALEQLRAGGSTHGAAGIPTAYRLAEQARLPAGINRVILATDGDFNVGTVNHEALIQLIEQERAKGISLTTLGFGGGNYNDQLMEQLADQGNGNYAYIDTLQEGRKVLVDELAATLETIAGDVKVQIEFNPAQVTEYRLIGYENRLLAREDFTNDRVDAGEVGAGHRVTALYEITLAGQPPRIEPLRYGTALTATGEHAAATTTAADTAPAPAMANEVAFLKLRYKLPGQTTSTLVSQAIAAPTGQENASEPLRFAATVAAFGQYLRGGAALNGFTLADIVTLASDAKGEDASGYRAEFIGQVKLAQALDGV